VRVDGGDALVGARLEQLRRHHLFNRQHDAVLAPYANGRAAILDSFERVVDLEVLAVGREDGVVEVVAGSY
jgi:hypothetical protein